MPFQEDKDPLTTVLPLDRRLLARLLSEQETGLEWESFSPEDWSEIVSLSEVEGVGPQLYWVLSKSEKISYLPQSCRDRLRAMYVATRLNNEQILRELENLTSLFEQAEIPVVALKGICFALTIYPDIGLRPMGDLDLLVPASSFADAVRIAKAAGYNQSFPEAAPGLDELLSHAVCFVKMGLPYTTLEIHHTLVGVDVFQYAVPMSWFWTQIEYLDEHLTEYSLQPLHQLTPTAQLLYGCAHAMLQHGGRITSLRWMYDLDRLVRVNAPRLKWDLLLSQALKFEWSSAVSAALSQLIELFDSPIPKFVLDDLAMSSDRNKERVIEMQVPPATHTLEEYQKFKALNTAGRLRLFVALVIPTPAYIRWRYKLKTNWALPGWYIHRWWRIFKDVMLTVRLWSPNTGVNGVLDKSPGKNESSN
jgi:hypothetical protein